MQSTLELLDDFPVGVCIIDESYEITYWNRRLENWTKLSTDSVVGSDLRTHFPHFAKPHYTSRLELLFKGGAAAVFSSLLHKSLFRPVNSSTKNIYNTTAISRPHPSEQGFEILFVVEDVTALHKRSEELERSNSQLEKFVHIASHDLQAPIRRVKQFLDLLEQELGNDLTEDIAEHMSVVVKNSQQMEKLLAALFEYATACHGKVNLSTVSLDKPIDQALDAISIIIEETDAVIRRDPFPQVQCDCVMIGIVFQNLVGNALKYIKGRKPEIHLLAREEEIGWVFGVRDNGIGISDEHKEMIFSSFKRLHTKEEFTGSGIGLSTCKNIIERHGGKIWVESELGVGSTFFFTL